MEKTLVEQSLSLPELFDLNELVSTLKITPGQLEHAKGMLTLEGLTESQIRLKGRMYDLVKTGWFGVNSSLYYLLFQDRKGYYLCLFNGDRECFRALFFTSLFIN